MGTIVFPNTKHKIVVSLDGLAGSITIGGNPIIKIADVTDAGNVGTAATTAKQQYASLIADANARPLVTELTNISTALSTLATACEVGNLPWSTRQKQIQENLESLQNALLTVSAYTEFTPAAAGGSLLNKTVAALQLVDKLTTDVNTAASAATKASQSGRFTTSNATSTAAKAALDTAKTAVDAAKTAVDAVIKLAKSAEPISTNKAMFIAIKTYDADTTEANKTALADAIKAVAAADAAVVAAAARGAAAAADAAAVKNAIQPLFDAANITYFQNDLLILTIPKDYITIAGAKVGLTGGKNATRHRNRKQRRGRTFRRRY